MKPTQSEIESVLIDNNENASLISKAYKIIFQSIYDAHLKYRETKHNANDGIFLHNDIVKVLPQMELLLYYTRDFAAYTDKEYSEFEEDD